MLKHKIIELSKKISEVELIERLNTESKHGYEVALAFGKNNRRLLLVKEVRVAPVRPIQ